MLELWSIVQQHLAKGRRHDRHRTGHQARGREAAVFERIEAFRRRRPRLLDDVVTLAHGAGGKASAALLDAVFLPAFAADAAAAQTDAAVLALPSGERLAFSTDSYVVKPLRFPGGSVGHLAVHGTVNDLAMMGARPMALSAAFVLEEGFPIDALREIVADMAEAAASAGVSIVTGDTKVVDRGAADGLYISTAGIGLIPAGRELSADEGPRGRCGPLLGHHRRPRHRGHAGPGRPGPRGRHRVGHGAAEWAHGEPSCRGPFHPVAA